MAALSNNDRAQLDAEFQRVAENIQDLGVTKAELRAAVDAVDDWADANASAFNTAIPQPARGAMTTRQKTMLLMYVILKRAGVL
jgi:hypothetical protein